MNNVQLHFQTSMKTLDLPQQKADQNGRRRCSISACIISLDINVMPILHSLPICLLSKYRTE